MTVRVEMEEAKIKAAFLADEARLMQVYGAGRREQVAARTDLLRGVVPPAHVTRDLPLLGDVEVLFSTWGMPRLTDEQLDALPKLRAVFYAAGSVQGFVQPLLERGIIVVSAWRANAVPVAEFALAQILLACKGYWRNRREYDGSPGSSLSAFRGPGVYGGTVALLGAGAVGRVLIELLQPFRLRVIVYDPFLSDEAARELGVERVPLEVAFAQSFVVSNHLADKSETEGLIDGGLLSLLQDGGVFVNTGRGRTVNEADLAETLGRRPDLTALLDVTHPEPIALDSPLLRLPNVRITSHIAGSINDETHRMADYCIEEFDRYARGEPLLHAVTPEMLATMA